jgi:hypothetical protein
MSDAVEIKKQKVESISKEKPMKKVKIDKTNKSIFIGQIGLGIMYAMMGLFMIVAARFLATLPLNTPDIFEMIGRMHHVYEIRWLSSTLLFAMAAATILVGYFYSKNPPKFKWPARIMAVLHQPWLAITLLIVAALWILQANDPGGEIAEIFAPLYGIDVSTELGQLEYRFIMGNTPSMAFLFFAIGYLVIMPFASYNSEVLLQHTGTAFNQKTGPMPYERKSVAYAGKALVQAGIFSLIIGIAIFGVGFALGYGIDITYPFFKLSSYPLFLWVYPMWPLAFGGFCIFTGIAYYKRPGNMLFRTFAWAGTFVLALIPVVGWFYFIIIGRELWMSGGGFKESQSKKEFLIGLLGAILTVAISVVVIFFIL